VSDRTVRRCALAGPWKKLWTTSMRSAPPAARAVLAWERVNDALRTPEGGGLLVELPFTFLDLVPFPACAAACTPVLQ
jgi:hypothetical protein